MSSIGLSFASTYWYRELGLDFTQYALANPQTQLEHSRCRHRHMQNLYRSLGLPVDDWSAEVDPVVCGYGVATVAMIFGCRGIFTADKDPYAQPLEMSGEKIRNLAPQEDFSDNPVMRDLEEQAAWLVQRYGRARIAINLQSVPNIAFKLRGDQLMYDFFEEPELVHRLVSYVQQSWVNLRRYLSAVNERNHYPDTGKMVSLDNCTVALVSPDIYRDFFLPYDRKTAEVYRDNFGVHHCGGNMHLFSQYYATLGQGTWYDIGYGSEVSTCIRDLHHGEIKPYWSVRYGPAKLRCGDPESIREERQHLEACGADSINCIGVDPDTPQANLRAYLLKDDVV